MKKKILALVLAAACLLSGCNESQEKVEVISVAESSAVSITSDVHSHESDTGALLGSS